MKAEYVNPFIEGTIETFDMMCGIKPVRCGDLKLLSNDGASSDGLVATIGLSGNMKGAVIMIMNEPLARKIVEMFSGGELKSLEDLIDGFGEIINIIAGYAAGKLPGSVNLALPTVMLGKEQQIPATKTHPWVVVPLEFPEMGRFEIRISMRDEA